MSPSKNTNEQCSLSADQVLITSISPTKSSNQIAPIIHSYQTSSLKTTTSATTTTNKTSLSLDTEQSLPPTHHTTQITKQDSNSDIQTSNNNTRTYSEMPSNIASFTVSDNTSSCSTSSSTSHSNTGFASMAACTLAAELECPRVNEIPKEYRIRPLESSDYHRGFLQCLSQLTLVGTVTPEQFERQFRYMKARGDTYYLMVLEHLETQRIVGCATLLVERKFIHGCGSVGHIEDVVVCREHRGHCLGRLLVERARELARSLGCYKVILDCKDQLVGFYQRSDFSVNGVQMTVYFEDPSLATQQQQQQQAIQQQLEKNGMDVEGIFSQQQQQQNDNNNNESFHQISMKEQGQQMEPSCHHGLADQNDHGSNESAAIESCVDSSSLASFSQTICHIITQQQQ